MKKLLTALLVVAMVLSLCSVAFAADFSDTKDLGKDAKASIAKLSGLNVINGYPDGTFKPANSITRAEFAKIASVLGGMEKSADVLKSSPSKFSDVPAAQWYTGYVNLANSQGWVKGFPDGTFRPNAKISYAEVITVMVRILGYNDNLPGPWPVDYIAKAGALEITQDVAFDANAPATRSDVAVMADAALGCDMMKWDVDNEEFVDKYGNNDEVTLMEENFDSALNEDYLVTDVNLDDGVWSIDVKNMSPEDGDLVYVANNENAKDTFELAETAVIADGSLVTGLEGALIDFTYDADDEEIDYIEITSTTLAVDGADVTFAGGEFEFDEESYEQANNFVADETNDWDADGVVDPGDIKYDKNLADVPAAFNADRYYTASLNSDDEVYMISEKSTNTPALVDEYKASTEKLTMKYAGDYAASYDFTDEDVIVVKGGKIVTLADIQTNDVVYVSAGAAAAYGQDFYLNVQTISKEGKLSSFYPGAPDKVKIEGTKYDVASKFRQSRDNGDDFGALDFEDVYGTTVKYFLNKSNQVAYVISNPDDESASTMYGVVTKVTSTNIDDEITKIKVWTEQDTEVTYDIDANEIDDLIYAVGNHDLEADDFIKYTVNADNAIDSITVLAQWRGTVAGLDANPGIVIEPEAAAAAVDAAGDGNDDTGDNAAVLAHALPADYVDHAEYDAYIGLIGDSDSDTNRIKFAGDWYYMADDAVIFNGYNDTALPQDADDEAGMDTIANLLDAVENLDTAGGPAPIAAYVEFDGNKVSCVYVNYELSSGGADYALVLDNYVVDSDDWVDVDVAGTTNSYQQKSNADTFNSNSLYDYSLTSEKITGTEVFAPGVWNVAGGASPAGVEIFGIVTDVDAAKKAVEVAVDADKDGILDAAEEASAAWYYGNDDSYVYDYSDYYDNNDDPVFAGFEDIVEDQQIMIFATAGYDDTDLNYREFFIITDNNF